MSQIKSWQNWDIAYEKLMLIIEAKNADLARGFTQLAVELIALDQWLDSDTRPLYGVVSTGDIWQLGRLNRQQHQIEQDLSLYRVLTDLEDLFPILIAILTGIG